MTPATKEKASKALIAHRPTVHFAPFSPLSRSKRHSLWRLGTFPATC
jgi:hypothetical protein